MGGGGGGGGGPSSPTSQLQSLSVDPSVIANHIWDFIVMGVSRSFLKSGHLWGGGIFTSPNFFFGNGPSIRGWVIETSPWTSRCVRRMVSYSSRFPGVGFRRGIAFVW